MKGEWKYGCLECWTLQDFDASSGTNLWVTALSLFVSLHNSRFSSSAWLRRRLGVGKSSASVSSLQQLLLIMTSLSRYYRQCITNARCALHSRSFASNRGCCAAGLSCSYSDRTKSRPRSEPKINLNFQCSFAAISTSRCIFMFLMKISCDSFALEQNKSSAFGVLNRVVLCLL